MSHVRGTIRGNGFSRKEEAERVVAALKLMLHGTTTLLAYNIQRTILNIAFDEIKRTGTRAEQNALRREVLRRLELPLPLPG